jgi:hypothetical protein
MASQMPTRHKRRKRASFTIRSAAQNASCCVASSRTKAQGMEGLRGVEWTGEHDSLVGTSEVAEERDERHNYLVSGSRTGCLDGADE